jgi:hypothetical protein
MLIKVTGKTYDVEFVGKKELPDDLGTHNEIDQTIKIRKDQHPESQADTLLHELIHAIDYANNTGMTERQVHATASGLLQVIYDNPDFVEWIWMQKQDKG